jgi:hypothetical protein
MTTRRCPVDVELNGTLTLGMTVADLRGPEPAPRIATPRWPSSSTSTSSGTLLPTRLKGSASTCHANLHLANDKGAQNIVALMAALLIAIFAFQLNASMLSPALVTMQNELNTTADAIGLTQTVFFTAAALFSLFLPRLADLKGRRKVLVGMLALTGLGCVVSAAAPNVTVLMIGRALQGVAGPGRADVPDHPAPARDRGGALHAPDVYSDLGQRRHRRRRRHLGRLACRHVRLPLRLHYVMAVIAFSPSSSCVPSPPRAPQDTPKMDWARRCHARHRVSFGVPGHQRDREARGGQLAPCRPCHRSPPCSSYCSGTTRSERFRADGHHALPEASAAPGACSSRRCSP